MSPSLRKLHVAILGGGIAGTILALMLHDAQIPFTIYEQRSEDDNTSLNSGLILTSNSLRVLDRLGVQRGVAEASIRWPELRFVNEHNETKNIFMLSTQKDHGYNALRVPRHKLSSILRSAIFQRAGRECFQFCKKFSHVVAEDEDGVTFCFTDASVHSASVLVACDGIHSAARKFVVNVEAEYRGLLGLTATFPAELLHAPDDFPLPVTIQDKSGVYLIGRERNDPAENFFLLVHPYSKENDRDGWNALNLDRESILSMMLEGRQGVQSSVACSALDAVATNAMSLYVWPFYQLPSLPTWVSPKNGRVILMGDAAHATPPSSQQGAGMAIEDAFTLGSLIAKVQEQGGDIFPSTESVKMWTELRSVRIEQVRILARLHDLRRMKSTDRDVLVAEHVEKHKDILTDPMLRWLYEPNLEADVDLCVSKHMRGKAGVDIVYGILRRKNISSTRNCF